MKNKALIISAALVAGFFTTHAQENKVTSAIMHLRDFADSHNKDTANLQDAKDAIDLAAANDKTKDEPKMWLNRGNVYRAVFEHQLANVVSKLIAKEGAPNGKDALMKLTGEAYSVVDTTAVCIADYSYYRVIQLVPKDYYADEARQNIPACLAHIENKATSDYNRQKYAVSLAMFEKALMIAQVQMGGKDTAFISQDIQNAAITADKLGDHTKAVMYYQKMIDMKLDGSDPYSALMGVYYAMKTAKDSVTAVEVLKKGRVMFPNDVNLLIAETNVYLQQHNNDKAIQNLQTAISKLEGDNKPESKPFLSNLYFVLGNTYDRLANPKNDSGKALAKPANYEDLFSKAEDNYKKALTLTPDNFDENFDMGALYNNRATYVNRQANELPLDATDKFNKLQAQANDLFKKAQPWLEKAHQIKKDDVATINALVGIYASTGQTDKIKPIKEGQ